jgi:flagellar motility protein MotE (MotC chaperone)
MLEPNLEKHYHPENYKPDTSEELSEILDNIADAIAELNYYSRKHEDEYLTEVSDLEEALKACNRKQLQNEIFK